MKLDYQMEYITWFERLDNIKEREKLDCDSADSMGTPSGR